MHPLDNVIWKALTTTDVHFAEVNGTARRFPHEVTALGAFSGDEAEGFKSLSGLLPPNGSVALFLDVPTVPPLDLGLEVIRAIPLVEMLHDGRKLDFPTQDHIELGEKDVPEMLSLTELTKPGLSANALVSLGHILESAARTVWWPWLGSGYAFPVIRR